LKAVFKPTDNCDAVIEELMASSETMGPDDWDTMLAEKLPDLKLKLEADYRPERVRFNSFRSCGQQLSKLLANLERLKWRQTEGEDNAAEIETRQKQVVKWRKNGIIPSPGICVFNQLDFDKSGLVTMPQLKRMLQAMGKVYPQGLKDIEKIMNTLDSDHSGEIDEKEWINNLEKLPAQVGLAERPRL
jgi:hypothetical protein